MTLKTLKITGQTPAHSDFDEDLDALGDFIDTLSNVDRVEILPYHTLGKFKFEFR